MYLPKMFLLAAICLSALSLPAQTIQILESRANQKVLLRRTQSEFSAIPPSQPEGAEIVLMHNLPLQRMDGFGASLTESSATLLMQLPVEQRKALLEEIFSPHGPLGLTLLRQPIGASDFSSQGDYSYDDPPHGDPDPSLHFFSTAVDEEKLFPLLQQASQINPALRVILLPWSAPAWMKTSGSMRSGALKDQYLEVYAKYLARSVDAYLQRRIPVFALALQNEPLNENPGYPTQSMSPEQEVRLASYVYPLLKHTGHPIALMGYEHNWDKLEYPEALMKMQASISGGQQPLFDGISFHCYAGNEAAQLRFLIEHPKAKVWFTECTGMNNSDFFKDFLWQGQHLILGAPVHGASSVLLWNLVLDSRGNPHNGGCENCRGIFSIEKGSHGTLGIHRNVEYYLLAHAAPFIHPGAIHIGTSGRGVTALSHAAFINTDGTVVLLVLNTSPKDIHADVRELNHHVNCLFPAHSLLTLSWKNGVS